jgi:hypothetical protein
MKSSTQTGEAVFHLHILEKLDVRMDAVYKAEDTSPLFRQPEILAWRCSISSI